MTEWWIKQYGASRTSLRRFLTRQAANIWLPLVYRLTHIPQGRPVIPAEVSLTSFPARIERLWLTVESLLRQTVRPERIVIHLARNQFPNGEQDLPQSLRRLLKHGVCIDWVAEDLRSYKKFFPAWPVMEGRVLVTVDDDIFYPTRLLERLWQKHQEHPHAVIAAYTHRMTYDKQGKLQPYRLWDFRTEQQDPHLFFGSGGGTLFPAGALHRDAVRQELALQLCPQADDIWLNAMTRLQGTPIIRAELSSTILPVLNRQTDNLARTNLDEGNNDRQLKAIRIYYLTNRHKDPFRP